jgi:Zn-dependent oligopeptidase
MCCRELRQEKAKLLGFPTFAHLSMDSKVCAALLV